MHACKVCDAGMQVCTRQILYRIRVIDDMHHIHHIRVLDDMHHIYGCKYPNIYGCKYCMTSISCFIASHASMLQCFACTCFTCLPARISTLIHASIHPYTHSCIHHAYMHACHACMYSHQHTSTQTNTRTKTDRDRQRQTDRHAHAHTCICTHTHTNSGVQGSRALANEHLVFIVSACSIDQHRRSPLYYPVTM